MPWFVELFVGAFFVLLTACCLTGTAWVLTAGYYEIQRMRKGNDDDR